MPQESSLRYFYTFAILLPMLAIKLQRIGRKHQPSYRLVVAEARSKMAAPPVEDLGSYQPVTKAASFKKDRVSYWLGVGAQPTVTAYNLLVAQGIVSAPKRAVKMKKAVAAAKEEATAQPASATEATPAAEAVTENPATPEEPSV
jgi:small subunit ribosomal protein S16